MLGRDHALSGAAAFALLAPQLHVTGAHLAAGTVLAAGAAVLPDIDHPDATISRTFGFLTGAFAWTVEKVSGGHRHGTHSVIGIAVFTALAWAADAWRNSGPVWQARQFPFGYLYGRPLSPWHLLPEMLLLALLYSAGLRALRIGGHHGDLLGILLAAATTWFGWDSGAVTGWHLPLAALITGLGCACHIAGDEITHGGCPLAWPVSGHEFHLLPRPLLITTSRLAERAIVFPLLLALLALALARDTGILHHLGHHQPGPLAG